MTHLEALELLRPAGIAPGETWADLGAGAGTFTKVLAEFVGASGAVHAVDKDRRVPNQLQSISQAHAAIKTHQQDFTEPLQFNNLDGILMANSLHFVRNQSQVLEQLARYLKPSGKFVVLEYNIVRANPWVPFPLSFERLKDLAARTGLSEPVLVARKDSSYHREMYVATMTLKNLPQTLYNQV